MQFPENQWAPQETPALFRDLEQILLVAQQVVALKLQQIESQLADLDAVLGTEEANS